MVNSVEARLKIAYLFLAVGGWDSKENCLIAESQKLFNRLEEELDANKYMPSTYSIKQDCKEVLINFAKSNLLDTVDFTKEYVLDEVIEEIRIIANEIGDLSEKTHTVWLLVNFAYAEKECTDAEEKIIRMLIRLWQLSPSIFLEMSDTAETLIVLDEQKAWFENNRDLPYREVNSAITELDKNKSELIESINDFITLG
jgi:hypothetical protein